MGGSGGPPPGIFFDNGLLNRAFIGHFSAFSAFYEWKVQTEREENLVGKEGRPKLQGKKIKWGIREREGGKGRKGKR